MRKIAVRSEISKEKSEKLKEYSEFIRHLLFHRGVESADSAKKFLNPDYEDHVYDPFLMKDMDKAVDRILLAIKNDEKVVIFSDYDADGIPGAVVLHDFFKKIGFKNFENYIPHRHDEGFGLNHDAIDEFAKSGTKLLITIDCGIADADEVDQANSHGIDVIITDHHLLNGKIPKALAILDPKQPDCNYPEKNLCGAGVVFKLVQAILKKKRFGLKEGAEKWFLDMVGLATLSDMVSLTDENRVLAHYGLKVLRKSPRIGLKKLLSKMKVNQKYITEDDIGFMIAPRINAASRMGIPDEAYKLLVTESETEADELSEHLNNINNERKGVVAAMVKEMKHIVAKRYEDLPNKKVIVIGNPKWKPALLGLAANSLMEEYSVPVFAWGREGENILKGSCRSPGNVDLLELMKEAGEVFSDFGGHKLSGGYTLSAEKIHLLDEFLNKAYEKVENNGSVAEETIADRILSLEDVTWETYNQIEKLAPFGIGNSKPLFLFKNVKLHEIKQFGKEKNHMELMLKNGSDKKIPAIGFFSHPESWGGKISQGDNIDLLATMEKSTFRNYPELRLRIVDII